MQHHNSRAGESAIGRWLMCLSSTIFAATIAAIAILRVAHPLTYQFLQLGTFTSPPEVIVLHDQRLLSQTIENSETPLTHLGIYTTGPISGRPTAELEFTIRDQQQTIVYRSQKNLHDLTANDYTLIALEDVLKPNATYHLQLETNNVPLSDDFAIGYEPQSSPPFTTASIGLRTAGANPSQKEGHFAILGATQPTSELFLHLITHSLPLQITLLGIIIGWIVTIYFSKRLGLLLQKKLPVSATSSIAIRELLGVTAIAIILSLSLIWPYFHNPAAVSPTLRDAHRALIYLGIARDAVLQDQELALWDPYTCGGIPLLANAESSHTGPLFPLVLLFGEQLGLRLSILATLIIGFVGTYILTRHLGANKPFSLLAGTIFVFSSFQMVALYRAYYAWLPMGLIPWVIVFALRAFSSLWAAVIAAGVLTGIFLGGSLHMAAYALIGLFTLLATYAVTQRSLKPLLLAVFIPILAISLSALKLLPAAELQSVTNLERGTEFAPPLTWLPRLLVDRSELTDPTYFWSNGDHVTIRQFMSYVGSLPLILLLISLPFLPPKRYLPFIILSALSFLLMFGLPPHNLIQQTPILKEVLREPVRANILFVLTLGIIIAGGATRLVSKYLASYKWSTFLVMGIVLLAIIDIISAHRPLHQQVFTHPIVPLQKHAAFTRVTNAYQTPDDEYYTAGYINYLANEGVTNLCPVYLEQSSTAAQGHDSSNQEHPYHGEVFLTGEGQVTSYSVRPNTITTTTSPQTNGYLVLNQNFFPGWHASHGAEVVSYNGLIATPIASGETSLIFYYRPLAFSIGSTLTGVTGMALLLLMQYSFKQSQLVSHEQNVKK